MHCRQTCRQASRCLGRSRLAKHRRARRRPKVVRDGREWQCLWNGDEKADVIWRSVKQSRSGDGAWQRQDALPGSDSARSTDADEVGLNRGSFGGGAAPVRSKWEWLLRAACLSKPFACTLPKVSRLPVWGGNLPQPRLCPLSRHGSAAAVAAAWRMIAAHGPAHARPR
jgi:hypothetical protein